MISNSFSHPCCEGDLRLIILGIVEIIAYCSIILFCHVLVLDVSPGEVGRVEAVGKEGVGLALEVVLFEGGYDGLSYGMCTGAQSESQQQL